MRLQDLDADRIEELLIELDRLLDKRAEIVAKPINPQTRIRAMIADFVEADMEVIAALVHAGADPEPEENRR